MITNEERNARARERRANLREKKQAEFAAKYIDSKQLIARGFTRHAISTQLGEPDLVKNIGWRVTQFWLRDRADAIEPTRTRGRPSPEAVDVLAAIFAVNRSAKRYRDAAQATYQARAHGFARSAKEKKEELYRLKDRGIAWACTTGCLSYCGRHGQLAIYRGEGYCFHSTLVPENIEIPEDQTGDAPILIEAKPRGAKESRLTDAIFTLEQLEDKTMEFDWLDVPRRPKPQRGPVLCRLCGEAGHIARACPSNEDERSGATEDWQRD